VHKLNRSVGIKFLANLLATIILMLVLLAGLAAATTITFQETNTGVNVLIDNVKQKCGPGLLVLSCDEETARTSQLHSVCPLCDASGLFAAVLFEPGSIVAGNPEISDVVLATVTVAETLLERRTQFFFESDPDIGFWANNPPGLRGELFLLNALKAMAKINGGFVESGKAGGDSVLCRSCGPGGTSFNLFLDARGTPAVLDSSFQIVVASDLDAVPEPEPANYLLFGTGLLCLLGYAWRKRRLNS
jgi:hypothetical protein